MCDLYRVGTPGLYRLRSAFQFPPERQSFLAHVRYTLFGHARSLATIMAEALRHGPHAIADSWLPTVLYDSCKIMLFYLTQLIDPALETSKQLMAETIPHVRKNVKALKIMRSMYASASPLSKAAEAMLEKVLKGARDNSHSGHFLTEDPYAEEGGGSVEVQNGENGMPAQSAPDDVLNPLSIYRLTRKSIPEKHAPERQPLLSASCAPTPIQERRVLHTSRDESMLAPELRTAGEISTTTTGGEHEITTGGTDEQINFDELQSLFSSDPTGWTWQPAETAVGSRIESGGLPPWESTMLDGQLDAWLPAFALDP
jgi:hypothetical protein